MQIKVEGLDEIKRRFGNTRAMRRPLQWFFTEAAKTVQEHARGNAPQRTGKLKRQIAYRIYTRTANMFAKVYVKKSRSKNWPTNVGLWVETGTQPHGIGPADEAIKGRNARRLKRLQKAGYTGTLKNKALKLPDGRYFSRVRHPGQRAHPFMQPAIGQSQGAISGLLSRLAGIIAKEFGG